MLIVFSQVHGNAILFPENSANLQVSISYIPQLLLSLWIVTRNTKAINILDKYIIAYSRNG